MRIRLIYILFIGIIMQSCSSIYLPNTIVPYEFNGPKEVKASISLSPLATHANVAYSPINNLYVHADAGNVTLSNLSNSREVIYHASGGIGAYATIADSWHLNWDASYGIGEFDFREFLLSTENSDYLTQANGRYTAMNSHILISKIDGKGNSLGLAIRYSFLDINYHDSNILREIEIYKFNNTNRYWMGHENGQIGQFGLHFIIQEKYRDNYTFFTNFGAEGLFQMDGDLVRLSELDRDRRYHSYYLTARFGILIDF